MLGEGQEGQAIIFVEIVSRYEVLNTLNLHRVDLFWFAMHCDIVCRDLKRLLSSPIRSSLADPRRLPPSCRGPLRASCAVAGPTAVKNPALGTGAQLRRVQARKRLVTLSAKKYPRLCAIRIQALVPKRIEKVARIESRRLSGRHVFKAWRSSQSIASALRDLDGIES